MLFIKQKENKQKSALLAFLSQKLLEAPVVKRFNAFTDNSHRLWQHTASLVVFSHNKYNSSSAVTMADKGKETPKNTEQKNQLTRAMPEQSNDYRVVVFGAGGVGKSSLVLRFIRGTFRETYIPTIEDTYRQVSALIHFFIRTERI